MDREIGSKQAAKKIPDLTKTVRNMNCGRYDVPVDVWALASQ